MGFVSIVAWGYNDIKVFGGTTVAALPTISATTLEGAILELVIKLQELEKAATPPIDRANFTVDADTGEATISVDMPVTFSTGASGITVAANPYV
jgi:hypothetical protein